MIRIKRASIPVPDVFRRRSTVAEVRRAHEFFSREPRERAGESFEFDESIWKACMEDLYQLFHRKCAYCESRIERDAWVVDHFRPLRRASQPPARPARDHYGWLAYEWQNLYPACAACHKNKGSRFAVEGPRALQATHAETVASEKPLLLDPCIDDPEQYLSVNERGYMVPSKRLRDKDRARAKYTIDTLELNRGELVEDRYVAMREAAKACHEVAGRSSRLLAGTGAEMSHPSARIARALRPWMPFGAARRSGALNALKHLGGFGEQLRVLVPALASGLPKGTRARAAKPTFVRRRTVFMKRIDIENFRAIRHVTLDFGPTASPGWKVVLGENGCGKSALLQAVALALAGEHYVQRAVINWGKVLWRPRGNRKGPAEGHIRIELGNGETIELRFDRNRAWFTSGASGALSYLRAYGATRNLPNTRAPAAWGAVNGLIRIISILDTASPLVTAEGWLSGLTPKRFAAVAPSLKSVMQLREQDQIRRVRLRDPDSRRLVATPVVDIGRSTVRLDELSDGYQSVIALAVDIMAGLPKDVMDIREETGIVLVDELGNHLHPSWRMRVVKSFKAAFPNMQFLVTTHEPLCLRGLENDEVVVLKRDALQDVKLIADLPPVKGLLVDQILSSPHFGLRSTIDPEFAADLDEYYALLANEHELSPEGRVRLDALNGTMSRMRLVGDTPREQILLRVIDEHLARADAAARPVDPALLPDDLQQRLLELLAAADPHLDGAGAPGTLQ